MYGPIDIAVRVPAAGRGGIGAAAQPSCDPLAAYAGGKDGRRVYAALHDVDPRPAAD